MMRNESIESLDKILQDINNSDILFRDKVVVFGGDFMQVLPVVPRANRQEIVDSSLVNSYMWEQLIKIKLKQNMK